MKIKRLNNRQTCIDLPLLNLHITINQGSRGSKLSYENRWKQDQWFQFGWSNPYRHCWWALDFWFSPLRRKEVKP